MTIRFVCPGLTTIEPIDVVRDAGLNKETGSQDLLREDASEITDVEEETPEELGVDFEEFDGESSLRQRTSFDAVRFRGTSKSFDRKYALQGRYAFDVDDLPMPSRPGEQVIRGEDILPQIGIARAKESSSEDDLDMGKMKAKRQTGKLLLIVGTRSDRRRTFHTVFRLPQRVRRCGCETTTTAPTIS